jgi:hypothetical protein
LSLQKETNESYYKIATGILIITIGLIISVLINGSGGVATANGADGTQSAGETAIEEMPFVQSTSEPKISTEKSAEIKVHEDATPEEKISEASVSDFISSEVAAGMGQDDVSVAESCDWMCLDVDPGCICVYDGYFPDTLPVCITNDWLEDKWVTLCVYGGYEPQCGMITLSQCKTGKSGVIFIEWTEEDPTGCPCGAELWTATFWVEEPIVLDSNHVPDVCIPGCEVVDGPADLDKWVCACICTQWCGCCEPEQQFCVSGCICDLDVEAGSICLCDVNFPDSLPVCITDEWLEGKYITLCVYGGYDPIWGKIYLDQEKTGLSGTLIMHGTPIATGCPCGAEMWMVTFTTEGGVPIVFESNNLPEICYPGFEASGPDSLDKEVCLTADMCWEGCCEADQQFLIIPAHKSFVPESPNSR